MESKSSEPDCAAKLPPPSPQVERAHKQMGDSAPLAQAKIVAAVICFISPRAFLTEAAKACLKSAPLGSRVTAREPASVTAAADSAGAVATAASAVAAAAAAVAVAEVTQTALS
jgi:hypothetical protein